VSFLCYQGNIQPADQPLIYADDRSYRYGDGVFETMRIYDGRILLANLHFDRLFHSLSLLQFPPAPQINRETLEACILDLARCNGCLESSRVRLSFSSGRGTLGDTDVPDYIIMCERTELPVKWNETGLRIGLYTGARKNCDMFSNLKSASFLPYSMAARYACAEGLDDCLVLNNLGYLADSAISNLFLVQGEKLLTPSLDQGCVSGVMRSWVIQKLRARGIAIEETICPVDSLDAAGEVFLTNALKGIRWVSEACGRRYGNLRTKQIWSSLISEWLAT